MPIWGRGLSYSCIGKSPQLLRTLHQHPHTQCTYVASGCFEVTIGDEKKVLKAGDGYYVAHNLPHGCVCLEAGVLIDTFSPMREDFLK